jgi:radical SAM protein with 4Fe4S-binding SPASM domain
LYIQFFPTFRCNDSCAFCFNRGISAAPDIEVAAFRGLADILAGEGITEVDILGGEPTLHPELTSFIDIACSEGLYVSMSTNGSNIELLKSLSDNFDRDRLSIGISLNDRNMSAALSDFLNERRPVLKSVCTSDRFVPSSAAGFLEMPDIRYYAIFMDTMSGNDLEKSLSFPQFLRTLKEFRNRYGNLEGVYCSGFVPDIGKYPMLAAVRCPAGTTKLSVMPDGAVYPCYLFFKRPEFTLGNIMHDRLKDILKNPVLDYFREFSGNKCPDTTCELFSLCHGGCPAVSLLVNGGLDAPDPRCIKP